MDRSSAGTFSHFDVEASRNVLCHLFQGSISCFPLDFELSEIPGPPQKVCLRLLHCRSEIDLEVT